MSMARHPWGCTCRSHVDRPWNRSEHWSPDEVETLDRLYGSMPDGKLALRMGRSVTGIRLKAKRLGLHKRSHQGFTARAVAEIFGVDSSTVAKVWIRRGLMRARVIEHVAGERYRSGRRPTYWIVAVAEVDRFIAEHPELVDVDKMPPSPYRDAAAEDPWISLPEAHRRTGRDPHVIAQLIKAGEVRGRRRGAHWYMPAADVPKIRPLRSAEAIEDSWFRRQSLLEVRRNRRKGAHVRRRDGRPSLLAVQRIAS